jgi:integrase/recombinase XerC
MTQLDFITIKHLTLTEAFQSFCEIEMPARNFSAQTRRGYKYDLTEWLAETEQITSVWELTTYTIEHYLSQLDSRGLKGSTRHRKVAAIKTFLRYLEKQHALPKDFSSSITWPEVQRDEPRALSTTEYTAILREAAHDPRNSAMFEPAANRYQTE